MSGVRIDREDDVAILTLCDPPLNLVSRAMIDGLEVALNEVEAAPPRALLLRAEGEHFSAGADVADMFQGRSSEEARHLLARVGRLLARSEAQPYPTLAAVHGMCLAGGLELALACDLIWAADDAQLGLVETIIGAVPFGGGIQRLCERAGAGRAREMVLTAGIYDAATCERWNVVNRVLPGTDLAAKSLAFTRRLAAGPTKAYGATKRIVRTHLEHGLRAADALLPDVSPPLFETRDMQSAIASLLEKGPGHATFEGR